MQSKRGLLTAIIAAVLFAAVVGGGIALYAVARYRYGIGDDELKALGAIIASLSAAIWVVAYAIFTGAPTLERLKLAREGENYVPQIDLDLVVTGFTPKQGPQQLTVPISIYATAKNKGTKGVNTFDYENIPLLLIAKHESDDAAHPKFGPAVSLTYMKIHAPRRDASIELMPYRRGALQPGDTEHFAFLHPGLTPGIYLMQFQLSVPKEVSKLGGGAIWTRMLYMEVTTDGKVLLPTAHVGSPGETVLEVNAN